MKISSSILFLSLFLLGNGEVVGQTDPIRNCKHCLVVCEQSQHRIMIVNIDSTKIIWEWKAKDSNVAVEHVKWFDHPDEAKPVYSNKYILMTASGGVTALIRIADKKAVFYTYTGGNPHSAEMLPDGNIVAASSGGNTLKLFKVDTLISPEKVYATTYRVVDGHNVVWDKKREVLYAGSGRQLYSYTYNSDCKKPALKLSDSVSLPASLHDLFPVYGRDALCLTTKDNVFVYDLTDRKFKPASMAKQRNIKSVSSGPAGFPTVVIHPTESWWTDTVLNENGDAVFEEHGLKIYKARWLLDNSFSYPSDDVLRICR